MGQQKYRMIDNVQLLLWPVQKTLEDNDLLECECSGDQKKYNEQTYSQPVCQIPAGTQG